MSEDDPHAEVVAAGVMSAVGVRREMRRRHLDIWTVWAGHLGLGGTVTFPALSSALAGGAADTSQWGQPVRRATQTCR